jgi:adenylylsulfate kinase-like enzyme
MTKISWFTGLSGSCKSTLAKILNKRLLQLNFKVKTIDMEILVIFMDYD